MAGRAYRQQAQKEKEIGFSEFMAYVDQGNVQDVLFTGQEAKGKIKNPTRSSIRPSRRAAIRDVQEALGQEHPYSFKDISNGTWRVGF